MIHTGTGNKQFDASFLDPIQVPVYSVVAELVGRLAVVTALVVGVVLKGVSHQV